MQIVDTTILKPFQNKKATSNFFGPSYFETALGRYVLTK